MAAVETFANQLAEQLNKMALALQWSEKGGLLIAATDEPALEREMAQALRERVESELAIHEFTFSAQPIAYLSLSYILKTLPPPSQKSVLFVFGLDGLAPEDRKTAIHSLNWGRERLRWAGYSVVLWVRPATIRDLMFQVPDFYAWRTGTYILEVSSDATSRDQTFASLSLRVVSNFEALRQRYLRYVIESNRWLDFRGLLQVRNIVRLPLAELFVPLRFNDKDLIEKKLTEFESESFEDLSPDLDFVDDVEELETINTPDRECEQNFELDVVLKDHSHLVILGDPGSGKSTLLKYLALTFAEGAMVVKSRLRVDEERLPVLIPISAYAEARRKQNVALTPEKFIPQYFNDRMLSNLAPLLNAEMERGNLILLLDGIDEILTIDERCEIAHEIQAFAARHPQNRIVVTTRIVGYDAMLLADNFTHHLTIVEFGPQEIETYAHRWSLAYERAGISEETVLSSEAQARVEQRATNLTDAIKGNPNVERLAKNPLLLTILALIHHQGTRLPQRRVELYRLCIEALAETWNLARTPDRPIELWLGERRLEERQIVHILAPVAFWMQEHKPSGLISREELSIHIADHFRKEGKSVTEAKKLAQDFITLMQQVAGLIIERGQGQFGFLHLTFQEYLAARYLVERKNRWELILPHLYEMRWREVILLTAGILSEDDATEFVKMILETRGEQDDLQPHNLFLAAHCLADDVPVTFQLRCQIVNELIERWRKAKLPVLRWDMTKVLVNLRNTASEELVSKVFIVALRDENTDIRWRAAQALGQLGIIREALVTALLSVLNDKYELTRLSVVEALGKLGCMSDEVVKALVMALQDDDVAVRLRAVEALGKLGVANEEIVKALVTALQDENWLMRQEVVELLAKLAMSSEEVTRALSLVLHDVNWNVRQSATKALKKLGAFLHV